MGEEMNKEEEETLKGVERTVANELSVLDDFVVSVEPLPASEDNRDFVDGMFWDFVPGLGAVRKSIYMAQCENGEVPEVPSGKICVLLNYKMNKVVGKRDPLAGSHVLHIPSSKGPRLAPLHQVRKYALNLIKLVDSVEDAMAERDIAMKP